MKVLFITAAAGLIINFAQGAPGGSGPVFHQAGNNFHFHGTSFHGSSFKGLGTGHANHQAYNQFSPYTGNSYKKKKKR